MPSGPKIRACRNSSKRCPLTTSTRRESTSVATEYSQAVPGWNESGSPASTSIMSASVVAAESTLRPV